MKSIVLLTALILARTTSVFALAPTTSVVTTCVSQVWTLPIGANGVVACKGVKTNSDVNAVVDCVSKVWNLPVGANGVIACTGVKTSADVSAVVDCVSKVWNLPVGADGIIACGGT